MAAIITATTSVEKGKKEKDEEEEVALVVRGGEDDVEETEEEEGLDRSTEPTNDEFINFIVPDCLSQHENSKSCFFDNNNGGIKDGDGKDLNSEEEFFTPILPPEIEATVTSTKRTTPSVHHHHHSHSSTISKIFPTLITQAHSHSSKSCVSGIIKIKTAASSKETNVKDKHLINPATSIRPISLQQNKATISTPSTTTTSSSIISTTLATKPSIEAFPSTSHFSSILYGPLVTTPGAYPILFTSTISPFLSLQQTAAAVTTTSLPMGQPKVDDFPRTPLILTASGFVIIAIAVIVFWVFCCRQSAPMDLKTATVAIPNGYTPIPIDTFREPRNPSSQICPANGVIAPRPAVQAAIMPSTNQAQNQQQQQLQSNFNSPENGDVFKKQSKINSNGITISSSNGNHQLSNGHQQQHRQKIEKRKSDYKEWYV